MTSNRVLILIPGKNARGGITNYYSSVRSFFPKEIIYQKRGSRNWPTRSNIFVETLRLILDYIFFIYNLIFKKISLVQTTTAFYKSSIIRDGIFLLIAFIFRKKTIVFFRGWNDDFVYNLSGLSLKLFKIVFFNTDALIDLSEQNVNYLRKMGYEKEIYLETTVVDRYLLENIDVLSLVSRRIKNKKKTILFLSRIETTKGIYKLLETFQELKKFNDDYQLIFAGDGSQLDNLKQKIKSENINDVKVLGFVEGKQKIDLLKKATVFVFLSDFEGMPNAVLEAMSFGIPVITADVGGISSVFKDNHNGFLIKEYKKRILARKIDSLIEDVDFYIKISETNFKESKETFLSDIVAKRIMKIFENLD